MSVETDLAAAIVSMATAKAGYARELATDSATAYESYSLDGENVTRSEWREALMRMIKGLDEEIIATQQTLNALSPWELRTRQVY